MKMLVWAAILREFSQSGKKPPVEPQMDGSCLGFPPFSSKDFTEGSLEVKLPTTWRDGKAEVGTVREEKRREEARRYRRERVRRKKMQVHEKEDKLQRNEF
jgi:hypothetical protein